jgi:hypothetical protein
MRFAPDECEAGYEMCFVRGTTMAIDELALRCSSKAGRLLPRIQCAARSCLVIVNLALTNCSGDESKVPEPPPDPCDTCRAECVELNDFWSVFWCTQCCDRVCSESELSVRGSSTSVDRAARSAAFETDDVCVDLETSSP